MNIWCDYWINVLFDNVMRMWCILHGVMDMWCNRAINIWHDVYSLIDIWRTMSVMNLLCNHYIVWWICDVINVWCNVVINAWCDLYTVHCCNQHMIQLTCGIWCNECIAWWCCWCMMWWIHDVMNIWCDDVMGVFCYGYKL